MGHTLDTSLYFDFGATNPGVVSYTVGSGTTVLILMLSIRDSAPSDDRSGGAPTYNGVTMTQAGTATKAASSPETSNEIWYLLNPATGAHNFSVPNGGTISGLAGCAVSFKAGGGTSAFDNVGTATGTSTDPTSTATTLHDESVIVALVGSGATTWAPSARTGTLLFDTDEGAAGHGEQYVLNKATAGTQSMSWTFSTSDDWAIIWASFYDGTAPLSVNKSDSSAITESIGTPAIIYGVDVEPAPAYTVNSLKIWS